MKTYPLKSLTVEEAIALQFKLIDKVTREFSGYEILQNGDLGVHPLNNQPQTTRKVEKVIASLFDAEDAVFVRGAGTAAIREGLASFNFGSKKLLVHSAPIYSTTKTSIDHLNIETVACDFNDLEAVKTILENDDHIGGVLVQYTRQVLEDHYDMAEVIQTIKDVKDIPILTDDNYAVMKVQHIGVQLDAALSAFSTFKLLGPEGIGCVVGKAKYIETIRKYHYSGGSQTQGKEALDVLRSIVYAPVMLAIQATQIDEIVLRLNNNEVSGVKQAYVANAQSKVILVQLDDPIAPELLKVAVQHGAAPYPVGAESKYEIVPMFYRVSGTMLNDNAEYQDYWIRINPMRSGADTVLRILSEAIKEVK